MRFLPALFVATLVLAPLRAEPTDDESHLLKIAKQSYRDGAFELSHERAEALLKKYPKSELLPQAELIDAQALYQLGRSDAAVAAFTLPIAQVPAEVQSDTLFWQAESLLDLGRWTDAEQKYRALLALANNTPERQGAANLGLAWALFKEGRENDALPLIQSLAKADPKSVAGQQAELLQAKIAIAHGNFKDAIASLQTLLAYAPRPGAALPGGLLARRGLLR